MHTVHRCGLLLEMTWRGRRVLSGCSLGCLCRWARPWAVLIRLNQSRYSSACGLGWPSGPCRWGPGSPEGKRAIILGASPDPLWRIGTIRHAPELFGIGGSSSGASVRCQCHDTIGLRDAILTRGRNPTRVILIYRTETTTEKCKTKKTKK